MVRTYKRKTSRGSIDSSLYEKAARDVSEGKLSTRVSASVHNVHFMTLYRYIKRKQFLLNQGLSVGNVLGYSKHRQVFSDEAEEKLEDFIIQSCESINELTPKEMRSLAYIYAGLTDTKYPDGWDRTKEASYDWLRSFLTRRPKLAYRKGKRPSSAVKRNKQIVRKFFDDLEAVLGMHPITAQQVWAVGVVTVNTGSLQRDSAATVRVVLAANSAGEMTPPQFVFPLPLFKPHFISQGPSGSIGAASQSCSLTSQIFLEFMQHFHKHVQSSVNDPVLVIVSASFRVSSAVWNFCQANGILLLDCPKCLPQCLHPLEIIAFASFKKHYHSACSSWMENHPDSLVTVYDIPMIVAEALPCAITAKSLRLGFEAVGAWPFDRSALDKQYQLTSTSAVSYFEDTLSMIECDASVIVKQEPEDETPPFSSDENNDPICTSYGEMFQEVKTETIVKVELDFL